MSSTKELILAPEEAFDEQRFFEILQTKAGLSLTGEQVAMPVKRSIDARGRNVIVRVLTEIVSKSDYGKISYKRTYPDVRQAPRVIIIGSGPAGLFAALRLIELGVKPIVLERGKDVRARRRDLAAINKDHIVNSESNYCFGEGGAGTYSDGKLYTRSKKRGDVHRILQILVAHGAKEEILYDAHPHIGTNKLPKLVEELRLQIIEAGGEVWFESKVVDLQIEKGEVKGVRLHSGESVPGESVILATGHSARDIYHLLHQKGVLIEAKPFALGVRVEHQQSLIDQIQYHCTTDRGLHLPASSYSLVQQTTVGGRERGVFSFCMCPGGFIVPAATAPGEIVVNGMSPSRRDSRFANSGIVVAVNPPDFKSYEKWGPLAAMHFQAEVEQRAWAAGGKSQMAPAQRLADFVAGRPSSSLLETSYQPGLTSVELKEVLPSFISESLRLGFKEFGKKMKGYLTNEAQVIGVESRTSSPVRIPRDADSLEHTQLARLYPCGEGAGYAGGIVSAAMDGERCAEAVVEKYLNVTLK